MKTPKFALVVGHQADAPGAHGISPLNCYEYEYNKGLAGQICAALMDLKITSEIFFRDQIGIVGAYKEVNAYDPMGVIELHFNSANGKASGTETLFVPINLKSTRLAYLVQFYMCGAMKRKGAQNRGTLICDPNDRGHINLIQAKCPSILTEPFFGDHPGDAQLGYTEKNQLAICMAQAISIFIKEIQNNH